MSRISCLAPIAALLLAACVISGDDDDDADTSGNTNASASNSNSTTASTTTTVGTGDSTGLESTGLESSSNDGSSSSLGDTTASDSTGNAGSCGWGMTGEKTTPFGYICGGEGEDPDGMIDMACPAAVELVDQGECGGNMGITGAGCCDAEGNVWFCADDDADPRLFTQDC